MESLALICIEVVLWPMGFRNEGEINTAVES